MGISDIMQTGDVWRAIQDLRQQVQNLTSGRRLEDASVGARGIRLIADEDGEGGTLTIDGGTVRALSAAGVEIFAIFNLSGTRAWKLAYDDGPTAIGTVGSLGNQSVAIWDLTDHQVLATDSASETGLAKPYLNIPMYPSSGTSVGTGGPFWPQFTNTSYQEVMHGITTLWHPRIRIGVATNAPSGTVDWELQVDGTTIASGSGSSFATGNVPGWGSTTNPGDQRSVQLWCRNTSGVASRVTVDYCYGLQS